MSKKTEQVFSAKSVLATACCIYRQKGYTNTSTAFDQTQKSYTNKDMLTYEFIKEFVPSDYILKFSPTAEDEETAEAIIKYYRRLSFGVIGDSINDYLKRVFSITQSDNTSLKDFGVLASIPKSYERDTAAKQVKDLIKDTVKECFGKEGDSVILTIHYIKTHYIPSINCYGHEAITDTNHLVSFLNKIELGKVGASQKIRAKIKKHATNYHSKTPETQLNYVKVLDQYLVWQ